MEFVLQIEGVSKRFGDVVAVEDLTLSLAPGELFGFIGPNGAEQQLSKRSPNSYDPTKGESSSAGTTS